MEPDLKLYLMEKLPAERWFVSKSKEITDIQEIDSLSLSISARPFIIISVRVMYNGGSDSYMLYLSESKSPDGSLSYGDALNDLDFVNYIYGIFSQNGTQNTVSGLISGENFTPMSNAFRKFYSMRPFSGEQSNSSIILNKDMMMKVYRRRTDYYSPDYQIPKALQEQTRFGGTPECHGSIRYRHDEDESLLATVFTFIENEGDCWSFFTGLLKERLQDGGIDSTFLSEEITALGQLSANMHNALASLQGENFLPVPVTIDDLSSWLMALSDNVMTLDRNRLKKEGIPSADAIIDRARSLLSPLQNVQIVKTRIHGDYHLGQVLKHGRDYYVIDFEGEPMRSLEYRRLRHSPLKDVAGMIRSINYAAAFCTASSSDQDYIESGISWAAANTRTFLNSYLAAVDRDLFYIPRDDQSTKSLLDFFILDKALYEFNYEINNRPSWASIPLRAISNILSSDA